MVSSSSPAASQQRDTGQVNISGPRFLYLYEEGTGQGDA